VWWILLLAAAAVASRKGKPKPAARTVGGVRIGATGPAPRRGARSTPKEAEVIEGCEPPPQADAWNPRASDGGWPLGGPYDGIVVMLYGDGAGRLREVTAPEGWKYFDRAAPQGWAGLGSFDDDGAFIVEPPIPVAPRLPGGGVFERLPGGVALVGFRIAQEFHYAGKWPNEYRVDDSWTVAVFDPRTCDWRLLRLTVN